MAAIEYGGAGTCDKAGMIPDFTFLALEEVVDKGLIGSEFCFCKAKNISSCILHLEEEVQHIGAFVVNTDAINILKIDAKYLFSPDFSGNMALAWVYLLVYFTLIGKIKVII